MADETDRIQPAHILLLQEIDGVAVAFGEQRDQHVGAGDLVLARGLDVQDRALDDALEPGGGLRVRPVVGLERLVFLVEIGLHHARQLGEVDAAGVHHLDRVLVLGQGEQQMLERGVFVLAFGRVGERGVEGLFEVLGETGHGVLSVRERLARR